MSQNILEKILTDVLHIYMSYEDSVIEELLVEPTLVKKEQVKKIDHLEVVIHSNDHNPPHFHVRSNDFKIDAKFSIETGEYLSGEIGSKDLKRIKAYYKSPKTKIVMEKIWNKRTQP
ncbi:MAG: DUF4160 domain-containing protein [Chitinophagaceae bacterium]